MTMLLQVSRIKIRKEAHTHKLYGMASVLRMRTAISTRQWQ